uniref:Uncharacterized protein n=1 Tax=Panagrolaimus sp. JU765 TaxID=591449 RepID=A0AC34QCL4_9BILA
MQDSPNLIDIPRKNVMASVEVEEERENLSTVSAGADGSQSSGRCVADPLQQMSEEERLSKMQKENQKTCFKRRSSALHLSSVVEGVVPSPLLPLSEINDCYATRPKLMKRSESLSAEKSTGIQGFPSLADKSKHFMFEVVSIDSEEFSSKIVIKNMKTHQLYDLKLESIWSYTKLTVGNKVKIIDPEFQSHNVRICGCFVSSSTFQ